MAPIPNVHMDTRTENPALGARANDAERIVKLALCVKEHPGITWEGIREALPDEYGANPGDGPASERRRENASRRAFERDKETLREYGIYVEAGAGSRYSVDEKASYAAPIDLTDSETSLLRLLCDALFEDPSYPFKNELRMVLAKIGEDIDVPDLLPSMENADAGKEAGKRPLAGLAKVRRAIADRKRLSFEYRDAKGRESTRDAEPFGCFLLNRSCYVVAFDPSAGAGGGERVFRLDRMRKVHVNRKSPGTPDFAPRPFDASDWYGLPFQFGEENYRAEVAFDAECAWRAPRLSMGQGSFEKRDDSALIWTVRTRDTEALARWCVENGPGVRPIAPECAREAYARGVHAALDALDALGAPIGPAAETGGVK